MSLPPGTRLGAYEITAQIGAGGMGEVYRAHDAKLNRDVALKILPDVLASDPDRLARFRREAQVLASLNHTNIAHIYGFEESPSTGSGQAGAMHAIVMELVEGPTLADRIAAGPIPFVDALPIARQIADALESAHDQGIIHRDLKPANVKVRDDGTVKVLDFGLAKALDANASTSSSAAMNSPTLTARATQMGVILGTAAYMAPEQARGRSVDRRADIWAFGVVLYEMLSGRRAFDGDDISITLASVLKEDVDPTALPADLPAPIRRLLRRCLEKDPRRRLSAIGDARLELEDAATAPEPALNPADVSAAAAAGLAKVRQRMRRAEVAAATLTVAVVAFAIYGALRQERPTVAPERVQFAVAESAASTGTTPPSLSPDGRLLAFIGRSSAASPSQILVRTLGGLDVRAIAGTEGAGGLFWIDGSKALGYVVGGRVYRVALAGGTPQLVCEMSSFAGATWLPSGDILMASYSGANARLFRVPAEGGVAVEVARQKNNEASTAFVGPVSLPDGKRFLYLGHSLEMSERAIYVGSLDGAPPVRLLASESMAAYADPGFLLFVRGTTLFAQSFDAATLRLSGEPIRVVDGVAINTVNGRASFAVSQTGVLAYRTAGGSTSLSELAWFDRSGKSLGTVGGALMYYQIRLSPDARRVAVSESSAGALTFAMSVLDLGNGVPSAITDAKGTANDPVWSPDSESLAFEALQKNGRQLMTQRVGTPTPALAFESADDPKWLDDWSADGKFLLFHLPRPSKLFAVSMDQHTAQLLTDMPESIDGAHFSPDGKWVVYQVTESGVYQVWVASFPAFDKRQRVSPQGGGQAFWASDGREIVYLTPAGKLMSATVTRSPNGTLKLEAPVELFASPLTPPNLVLDQYSVTKDGKRFLFIRPREAGAVQPPVTVVVNWAAGVR